MSDTASYPMKIAALIEQAFERHAPIICAICGRPVLPGQKIAFDHRQAKGRGGVNTIANLRCVHAETEGEFACHAIKTNGGRAKATTRGTDNYEAKKTDRMIREGMGVVNKKPLNQVEDLSSNKCRKCGEFTEDCICQKRERRSGFARQRAI